MVLLFLIKIFLMPQARKVLGYTLTLKYYAHENNKILWLLGLALSVNAIQAQENCEERRDSLLDFLVPQRHAGIGDLHIMCN